MLRAFTIKNTVAAELPKVRRYWRSNAIATTPVRREIAEDRVRKLYAAAGEAAPRCLWFDSPRAASVFIRREGLTGQGETVRTAIRRAVREPMGRIFWSAIRSALGETIGQQLWSALAENIWRAPVHSVFSAISAAQRDECAGVDTDYFGGQLDSYWLSFYLICVRAGMRVPREHSRLLDIWSDLARSCFWCWPFDRQCILCERPMHLARDMRGVLHAGHGAALEFRDGWKIYCREGHYLPARYGAVEPKDWPAAWLLAERRPELRHLLLRSIGYRRILSELEAERLDSWREYRLLRVEGEIDVEPVVLLEMRCPSTGHSHVLRVPPDLHDAQAAARWINHGIDPDAFLVEH